jgi:hypothetical protein
MDRASLRWRGELRRSKSGSSDASTRLMAGLSEVLACVYDSK